MEQYLSTVDEVLRSGVYKPNRTGVDTIAGFAKQYTIDLDDGYPLLTTKKMDGFRWKSMLHEFFWYLSGEAHIRTLREHTGIWDEWADEAGQLDTAYGRFWRRYPIPTKAEQLPGERWVDSDDSCVTVENNGDERRLTFDQLQYVIETLQSDPHSRRMVVSAWHPANAARSTLPPCHYTFVFSVQGDRLNLHLTQRSADLALGVPFNIACYSLLLTVMAQQSGYEPGTFSHTLVDAHVYCGTGERGAWYDNNLSELQGRLKAVDDRSDYRSIRAWIEQSAPAESSANDGADHVPGLLKQLSREPLSRPTLEVADKPLDSLSFDDVSVRDYESYDGIRFAVAE